VQYQRAIQSSTEGAQAKTNVTMAACAAVLRDQNAGLLIHGHTHLPKHHQEQLLSQEWQRWVLSDWDLDHPESGRPRASALLINQDGVRYADLIKM
jgi:UDP-2,3-diacylglucosamine hydrolase